MPNLRTLADLIKGESHSIIEGLLQKNQSVVLSGNDPDATSLLALQLATDVAGGKEFLGKYATCGGPVLFFDRDDQRLKRDGKALDRRKSTNENIIVPELGAGGERDAVRLAHTEGPVLTIVNLFPGSIAYVDWLDKAKVSTIAVFGTLITALSVFPTMFGCWTRNRKATSFNSKQTVLVCNSRKVKRDLN